MAFATIDVTKGITGTIPVANGGTGIASGTTGQFLKFTGTTTIASAADNAGKILQVTHRERTGQSLVAGTTYEATPGYGSITPSSSSNKVLVMITLPSMYHSHSNGGAVRIVRESSVVSAGGAQAGTTVNEDAEFNAYKGTNDIQTGKCAFTFLDEPSTTSAVHYQVFIKNRAAIGHFYVGQGSAVYYDVTLMEISA